MPEVLVILAGDLDDIEDSYGYPLVLWCCDTIVS